MSTYKWTSSVDQTILLQRLRIVFGLTDVALKWIVSFLTERTHQIAYNGELSSIQHVLFGVPLGPLLYVLYTAELFHVVARHGLRLHMYADDCQVITLVRQPVTQQLPSIVFLLALLTSTTG